VKTISKIKVAQCNSKDTNKVWSRSMLCQPLLASFQSSIEGKFVWFTQCDFKVIRVRRIEQIVFSGGMIADGTSNTAETRTRPLVANALHGRRCGR
jgi:hypothetical protein